MDRSKKMIGVTLLLAIMGGSTALAQNKVVKGVVTYADDGEPVMGATVMVDGTSIGAATNTKGEFEIKGVPDNAKTLRVSYIGLLPQKVTIKGGQLRIALKSDDKQLNDVVVTAMGLTREKKSLGYAQQTVKAEELTIAAPASLTSALTGKAAGVQVNTFGGTVGASARISIRGNSSLASDQQPLIVVDGVPISNDVNRTGDDAYTGVDFGSGLNDINPEDIESIDVLKGGAAALYGMRASNGVILITTKKGNKDKKGTVVSYSGSVTFDQVANLPKMQNKYGQGASGDEYHWKTYGSDMTYQEYAQNKGFWYKDGTGSGVNDDQDASWGPRLDVGLKLAQFDSPLDADGNYTATPWVSHKNNIKDFFQTGVTQNHTVSIATTTEKSTTRASLSYRNQSGTIPNTDQTRYAGTLASTMELNKYVSMDFSANYTKTHSDNISAQGYHNNNPLLQLFEWSGRQINMKSLKNNWGEKDAQGNYTFYNWNSCYHVNPYYTTEVNTNSYDRDRFFGKASIFYQPLSWLKIEGRLGIDYYADESFQRILFDYDYPDGYFYQLQHKSSEVNADLIATANKYFGDFSVVAMLGANYRDKNWEMNSLEADGLTVPGYYSIGNALSPVPLADHSHTRSNSIYANVSLGWRSQLYLDASARNDWSSTLKDDFFYPSVSMSWLPFESFQNLKTSAFSYLKLRGGYAEVGSATSPYLNSYYYYASSSGNFHGTPSMYKSMAAPNYNLKPERARTWEVGAELGFLDDRIHLDLAYYSKSTKDQILYVSTSNTVGFTSKLINAGEITNKGVEIQLSADIFKNPNGFSWTSALNFSKDKNKIVSLADGLDTYTIGWSWGISTVAKVGDAWGDLVGTAFDRTEDGAIKLSSNGTPLKVGSQVIGNVNPDYLMSWRNDFKWKNWSAGFMLDFRKGGDIYSQTLAHMTATGTAEYTAKGDIRERALTPGVDFMTGHKFVQQDANGNWVKSTAVVNAQDWYGGDMTYGIDEMFVMDGSFLKLRELYLTYTFPKSLLAKTKYFSAASVSLVANNLALLWVDSSNKLRIDPETGGVASDSGGVGFEQASTPSSRSFGIKLNLTF